MNINNFNTNSDGIDLEFTGFYNISIYARLVIEDEEFNLDKYLESPYTWDKDQVMQNFFTDNIFSNSDKKQILSLIPAELDNIRNEY